MSSPPFSPLSHSALLSAPPALQQTMYFFVYMSLIASSDHQARKKIKTLKVCHINLIFKAYVPLSPMSFGSPRRPLTTRQTQRQQRPHSWTSTSKDPTGRYKFTTYKLDCIFESTIFFSRLPTTGRGRATASTRSRRTWTPSTGTASPTR